MKAAVLTGYDKNGQGMRSGIDRIGLLLAVLSAFAYAAKLSVGTEVLAKNLIDADLLFGTQRKKLLEEKSILG